MKFILAILLATFANSVWADESVDIANPTQILELATMQQRLDSASDAIMGCMDSGMDHSACLCEHRELIISFNSSVKNVFANHPSLAKFDLVRFKSPDGIWVTQSLKGIRKQASIDPPCP